MSLAFAEIGSYEEQSGLKEPRRRRWTVDEYHRMAEVGLLDPDERVELIDGVILKKWTEGPEERRWTYEEYEQLGQSGILGPEERVELFDGIVVEMSPQLSPHSSGIQRAIRALTPILPAGHHLRSQLPLAVGRFGPEPDVAVVAGEIEDYEESQPVTAVLVVEVSDSTLAFDRGGKASLYARLGVPEYWVVNLVHDCVEVLRDPEELPGEVLDYGYGIRTTHHRGEKISSLLAPAKPITVDELLPRVKRDKKK